MAKVTFLIGLSASGKSVYLQDYIHDGIPVFDDLMKGSPSGFINCKHLPKIEKHLSLDRDIVLSDICMVREDFRAEILERLSRFHFDIEYLCFKNDPAQCLVNSENRAKKQACNHQTELKMIPKFSDEYTIPEGAELLDVVTEKLDRT